MKKETCHHCGASMMTNRVVLSQIHVSAMVKMLNNPNTPVRKIGLSKSEYANYTKLKYWNFIEKIDDGLWVVTELGKRFLNGKLMAPKELDYFRDQPVEWHGQTLAIDLVKEPESRQKYRELMRAFQ